MVKQVVLGALTGMGFDVVDIDLATTPTTELAVAWTGGGISIITKDCNVQSYMNTMYSQKTKGAKDVYKRQGGGSGSYCYSSVGVVMDLDLVVVMQVLWLLPTACLPWSGRIRSSLWRQAALPSRGRRKCSCLLYTSRCV